MSGRYKDYKGSSRSARDDSRPQRERDRSRSPQRHISKSRTLPAPSRSRYSSSPSPPRPPRFPGREHHQEHRERRSRRSGDSSDEEVPAPPPPPRISKISIDFSKPKAPIKMNLGGPVKKSAPRKPTVASVFAADDDDDEPEEMPAEAKMRMRNIGRETPTSAGPNSFGKTKHGFCDAKKVFEKNLKHALETVDGKKVMPKFPQTIYKISGNGPV